MKKRMTGFTLIEVVVAIAIIGVSLVMILQLFSGGLRASRSSCDYSRAIVHAKNAMETLSSSLDQDSGEFEDGFKWESSVELFEKPEDSDFNLLKLKVVVSWDDALKSPKSIEYVSLKTVSDDET